MVSTKANMCSYFTTGPLVNLSFILYIVEIDDLVNDKIMENFSTICNCLLKLGENLFDILACLVSVFYKHLIKPFVEKTLILVCLSLLSENKNIVLCIDM